jgi:hypothetical protein
MVVHFEAASSFGKQDQVSSPRILGEYHKTQCDLIPVCLKAKSFISHCTMFTRNKNSCPECAPYGLTKFFSHFLSASQGFSSVCVKSIKLKWSEENRETNQKNYEKRQFVFAFLSSENEEKVLSLQIMAIGPNSSLPFLLEQDHTLKPILFSRRIKIKEGQKIQKQLCWTET